MQLSFVTYLFQYIDFILSAFCIFDKSAIFTLAQLFPLLCLSLLGSNCKQGCVFRGPCLLPFARLMSVVDGIPTAISQEEIGDLLWSDDIRNLVDVYHGSLTKSPLKSISLYN